MKASTCYKNDPCGNCREGQDPVCLWLPTSKVGKVNVVVSNEQTCAENKNPANQAYSITFREDCCYELIDPSAEKFHESRGAAQEVAVKVHAGSPMLIYQHTHSRHRA
jgi:hypothetical protein